MQQLIELVTGLFSDPKATMYRAREEECRAATLALAGGAVAMHALLMLIFKVPPLLALGLAVLGFVGFWLPIWLGGSMTGGTGSAMDLLQLCGLVYMPLAVVGAIAGAVHLGFVGWVLSWIVMYWLVMIGHNFSTFDELKLAYAASIVASLVINAMGNAALVAMFRASGE